jgi:hypothetical protein
MSCIANLSPSNRLPIRSEVSVRRRSCFVRLRKAESMSGGSYYSFQLLVSNAAKQERSPETDWVS